jgi:hypothetical protein
MERELGLRDEGRIFGFLAWSTTSRDVFALTIDELLRKQEMVQRCEQLTNLS